MPIGSATTPQLKDGGSELVPVFPAPPPTRRRFHVRIGNEGWEIGREVTLPPKGTIAEHDALVVADGG